MEEVEAPPKSVHDKITAYKNMVVEAYKNKPVSYWILLLVSSLGMLIAFPASSLLSRLYFSNGGKSKWIISWVSVAGWPIPLFILLPMYFFFKASPTPLTLNLTLSYIGLGFLSAADNLMYAYAYAYLPASTASLLASTVLIFSAIFGYFIVNNKINLSTINSIVVITAAMIIIALDSDSDRFSYITDTQYALGFMWDILGSALHGLIFALCELVFIKLLEGRSFHVVLEQQVAVSFLAFVFTTIGVVVNNDFHGMSSEAKSFIGGESAYYNVIIWGIVTFQLGVLGSTAVLYLSSNVIQKPSDTFQHVRMTSVLQFSFAPVAGHARRRRQPIVASADRQALFSRIAPVYDNLNDVLSLGQHRIWKRMAVDWSGAKEGSNVLDLCCGSGDLAFLLSHKVGFNGQVIGLDFSREQLAIASSRQKIQLKACYYNLKWVEGDALNLPFSDCYFDAITMGYGLRNVIDKYKAMKEVYRVLKPGSKASILDFNKSNDEFRTSIQGWMIDNIVVPVAAGYGLSEEYQYLKSSIQEFLTGEELEHLALKAGFSSAKHFEVGGGLMGNLVATR